MVRVRVEATQEEIALITQAPRKLGLTASQFVTRSATSLRRKRKFQEGAVRSSSSFGKTNLPLGNGSLDRYRTVASATIQCRDSRDPFSAHLPQGESFYNPRDNPAQEGGNEETQAQDVPWRLTSRRPKTGNNKGMLILLSQEEKISIEKAAAKEGVSMSRFIVERALNAAKRVLSQTA